MNFLVEYDEKLLFEKGDKQIEKINNEKQSNHIMSVLKRNSSEA